MLVLKDGDKWPSAALGSLYLLPKSLDADTLAVICKLDAALPDSQEDAVKRLKVGITAVLARDGSETAMTYLRSVWDRDPERRKSIAMGLSQAPSGENWKYLVNSLPVLEGTAALDVLTKLRGVPTKPDSPEAYRQVILHGLRQPKAIGVVAVKLMEHWSGEQHGLLETDAALKQWQIWFATKYPSRPPAELPKESKESKWDYNELLAHLTGPEGDKGVVTRGRAVFAKATCVKCHRYNNEGETLGPDLSSIANRFTKKEILQSIVFPSHVISDQYAAKKIRTADGLTLAGIVAKGPGGRLIVLKTNGEKVEIADEDVEQIAPSRVSAMPEGLIDSLSLEEVTDLFAYLTQARGRVARRTIGDLPKRK